MGPILEDFQKDRNDWSRINLLIGKAIPTMKSQHTTASQIGEAAGQSVFHCHMHIIPRYKGDVPNPKGGVRGVIPSKQKY